jgi:hypothetical protein
MRAGSIARIERDWGGAFSRTFVAAKPQHRRNYQRGDLSMRATFAVRSTLIAFLTVIGVGLESPAYADSGSINIRIVKAGFVVGGSVGSGSLLFHGRRYPLNIGGLSYGFTFGASETRFRGSVSNIRRPSDVGGVYAAGNVGAAIVQGAQAIVLTNPNGAVLSLSGNSVGAIVSADLNGLAITVK